MPSSQELVVHAPSGEIQTEAEWLTCIEPVRLLECLRRSFKNLSRRKLLLFALACCRGVVCPLADPRGREAVDVLERYADGAARDEELHSASSQVELVWRQEWGTNYVDGAVYVVTNHAANDAYMAAVYTSVNCAEAANYRAGQGSKVAEQAAQSTWLRDIFPNPFRPILIRRAWLNWNNGSIPQVARAMYGERRFDLLPVLAHDLELVGCDSADLLAHCHHSTEHVRGCWVVDALLGKA